MGVSFDKRIYNIFQRVLRISPDGLSDQTRRGNLEVWDSLSHILIVAALSEEFEVNIPPEEALEMETIQDVKQIISRLTLINEK